MRAGMAGALVPWRAGAGGGRVIKVVESTCVWCKMMNGGWQAGQAGGGSVMDVWVWR